MKNIDRKAIKIMDFPKYLVVNLKISSVQSNISEALVNTNNADPKEAPCYQNCPFSWHDYFVLPDKLEKLSKVH